MSSASLTFTHTPDTQKLVLFAGSETYSSEVLIDAVVVSPTQSSGTVQPSPLPPTTIQPPLPKGFIPDNPLYTSEGFDYLTLGRLQTQASEAILISVGYTTFEVFVSNDWLDLSDYFVNGDYSLPISGASQGQVTLEEIGEGERLNSLGITYGTPFRYSQCFRSVCIEVFQGFVIEPPTYQQESEGYFSLTLKLGDELLLKADTSRVAVSKYCGSPPTFAGDAARIYAQTHNLITTSFPNGHTLLDRESQSFTNEKPYDFLQSLYSPTNHDVRCNSQGIIVTSRKPFNNEEAIIIQEKQVIELTPSFRQDYEPVTKIQAKNQFLLVQGFTTRRFTKKAISGDPTNTKPWFQGGYTETTTTQVFYGDTIIWSEELTQGYVPTSPTFTKAQAQGDPCFSELTTTFTRISRKVTNLSYYTHISGSFLVSKKETWTYSKKLKDLPPASYEIYDGIVEYILEEYQNTPQINSEVCEKDFIHLQTQKHLRRWGLLDDFTYLLLDSEIVTYTVEGLNPDSVTSYVGSGQQWNETIQSGSFDTEENIFITQPTEINEAVDPPTSIWIRPQTQRTNAFTQVSLNVSGSVELKPINAPFCYNLEQLNTFGLRFLRETYGLANGISLVVPYWLTVKLGDSVKYKNKNYLVFNIEFNQTLNEATKTLLLSEWID